MGVALGYTTCQQNYISTLHYFNSLFTSVSEPKVHFHRAFAIFVAQSCNLFYMHKLIGSLPKNLIMGKFFLELSIPALSMVHEPSNCQLQQQQQQRVKIRI